MFNPGEILIDELDFEDHSAIWAVVQLQYNFYAAKEAVVDSGLDIAKEAEDVGVYIGSGIGGIEMLEKAKGIQPLMTEWRRDFHMYPELGCKGTLRGLL